MRYFLFAVILSVCVVNYLWAEEADGKEDHSYAIIVSNATYADASWKEVADTLKNKHHGSIIRYEKDVAQALDDLKEIFPEHTCFVCRPEEAGREFVANAHVLTRKLDDDPYGDTIWGIITGYEAADALRIAKHDEPLVVRRALSSTVGAQLDSYEEGLMFNELKAQAMWQKAKEGKQTPGWCPTDTTRIIADALVEYKPDIFITSGHASERDWMIGFSYRNGFFRCSEGQWYAEDTRKNRFDINSPNPKVFMGIGNCLIGHIPDKECMALAMMHTGGFYQFVGYTIPTGYGYGGWGVKDYFSELQAGRFTLSQANYVNNQALVFELKSRGKNKEGRSRGGLRSDRDVVVMYGDPAWQAQMPKRGLPWSQNLTENDGTYTLTIIANERGDWDNRPLVHLLPHRIKDIEIIDGKDLMPVITDNFILMPLNQGLLPMKGNRGENIPIKGDFNKGDVLKVIFKAKKI